MLRAVRRGPASHGPAMRLAPLFVNFRARVLIYVADHADRSEAKATSPNFTSVNLTYLSLD